MEYAVPATGLNDRLARARLSGMRQANKCSATTRKPSPRRRTSVPKLERHRCVAAFSSIASNTGESSPGELEMTRSTSAVAVCCSSRLPQFVQQPRILDGDDDLSGEVLHKRRSALSVNGRASRRRSKIAPITVSFAKQGHDAALRTMTRANRPSSLAAAIDASLASKIRDVDGYVLRRDCDRAVTW